MCIRTSNHFTVDFGILITCQSNCCTLISILTCFRIVPRMYSTALGHAFIYFIEARDSPTTTTLALHIPFTLPSSPSHFTVKVDVPLDAKPIM